MDLIAHSPLKPAVAVAIVIAIAALPGCGTTPRKAPPAAPVAAVQPPPAAPTRVWRSIGTSVERRQLLVAQSGAGPLRVYVIGGVHGDETEGRSVLQSLVDEASDAATIRILRDLNPDGTWARRRVNANGYDLNRNWPATNFKADASGGPAPLSEPETRALEQDLRAFRPDVVVVLHSISAGPLVNYDGPAEALASAFVGAAQAVSPEWHVRPEMGYETSGSLGSYLGVDRQLPILTIELGRGQDEASATAALRKGLAAVILAAGAPTPAGGRTDAASRRPALR
jgi:protein MpaA